MEKKMKIGKAELAWYIVAAVFGLAGLVFVVFGIIGDHFPGLASDNWVKNAEGWLAWSGMGYRWWGLILLGVAVLIFLFDLNVSAQKGEKDDERALRRAQRLKLEEEAKNEKVVEVEPVEAPKAE